MYSLSFLLLVSGLLNFVSSSKFKNKSYKQSDILFPWFTKKEKILLETLDTGLPTKRAKCILSVFFIFIIPFNCKLASFFVYSK